MLEHAIVKRTSIRKYNQESLDEKTIEIIRNIIISIEPLYPEIPYKIDMVLDGTSFRNVLGGIVGSYGKIYAPHYLVVSTTLVEDSYEQVGYLLEYVVLKLTEMNLGTCWIGGGIKKDLFKEFLHIENNLTPIVVIAFGKPENLKDFKQQVSQFKRKSIDEICFGNLNEKEKKAMELVRLSPSSINSQPYRYFFNSHQSVDIYRVKHNFLLKKFLDENNRIDVGISLCHFEIGMNQKLKFINEPKEKEHLIYYKTIHFIDNI